jgi:hypothetical protein
LDNTSLASQLQRFIRRHHIRVRHIDTEAVFNQAVLCQAAWAAAHTKHSYPAALFYRIASRAGRNKTLIAVARHLIVIAYHLIREPVVYRDLGENYFDALHAERTKRRLVKRLEHLGHQAL